MQDLNDLTREELINLMMDNELSQEEKQEIARALERVIQGELKQKIKKSSSGKKDSQRLQEAIESKNKDKVKRYLKACAESGTLTNELEIEAAEIGVFLRQRTETVSGVEIKKTFQATLEGPEKTLKSMFKKAYQANKGMQFVWQGVPMTLHKPSSDGKKGWRFSIKAENGKRKYGLPVAEVQELMPLGLVESIDA